MRERERERVCEPYDRKDDGGIFYLNTSQLLLGGPWCAVIKWSIDGRGGVEQEG